MANRLLALSLALVAGLALWFWLGTDEPPIEPAPDNDTAIESPDTDSRVADMGSRSVLPEATSNTPTNAQPSEARQVAVAVTEPGAGAEIVARVIDQRDRPVAAASVSLRRISLREEVLELTATTDAEGRFRFTEVPCGERFSLGIDGGSNGRLERWLRRNPAPGQQLDLGVIRLRPVTVVTGRVVETDGSPIANAGVRFSTLPASTLTLMPVHRTRTGGPVVVLSNLLPTPVLQWSERIESLARNLEPIRTTTDTTGSFQLELPEGTEGQILVATDAGRSAVREWNGQGDGQVEDIQLAPLVAASIRVLDRSGNPAVGAELRLAPVDGPSPVRIATQPLIVAEDGSVALERFPTTRAAPLVRTDPKLPWSLLDEVEITDCTLTLPESAALTLLFDRGSDLPNPGDVEIHRGAGPMLQELTRLGGVERVGTTPVSDPESGTLRYGDLPFGAYTIRVSSEGRSEWVGTIELEGDRTVEIARTPSRTLSLTVLDPEGTPVVGAEALAVAPAPDPATRPTTLRARTDSDGAVQWNRVPESAVRVFVHSQLHGRATAIAPPGSSNLEMRLPGTGTLEGELLEVDDPTAWAIEVIATEDPAFAAADAIGSALWSRGSSTTRPEADGTFRFDRLPTGAVRVEARRANGPEGGTAALLARGLSEPEATAETTIVANATQRVLLRPESASDPTALGAKVQGTVRVDGKPAAGLMVVWTMPDQERPSTTRTDAEGRFDLGVLPAGSREMFVYDLSSQSRFDNQPHLLWRSALKVAVARDQDLTIEVTTGSIAGRVLDANGAPLARQFVLVEGELNLPLGPDAESETTRTIVVTDADGKFEAKGLAPGRWKVRLRPSRSGTPGPQVEDLVLAGGENLTGIEIRVPE